MGTVETLTTGGSYSVVGRDFSSWEWGEGGGVRSEWGAELEGVSATVHSPRLTCFFLWTDMLCNISIVVSPANSELCHLAFLGEDDSTGHCWLSRQKGPQATALWATPGRWGPSGKIPLETRRDAARPRPGC